MLERQLSGRPIDVSPDRCGSINAGRASFQVDRWRSFADFVVVLPTGTSRSGPAFQNLQPRYHFPLAHAPERSDGMQVLATRTHFAFFPVVDGLRRGAHKKPAVGCRKTQAPALRSQTLCAESARLFGSLGRLRRRNLGGALVEPAQSLLEHLRPPLEGGDLRAMGADGLLEGQGLSTDFPAGNARNLCLEKRCNVWHACDCAALGKLEPIWRLTAPKQRHLSRFCCLGDARSPPGFGRTGSNLLCLRISAIADGCFSLITDAASV